MLALKSPLRGFIALQAILLLLALSVGLTGLVHPEHTGHVAPAFIRYAILAAALALSLLFAMAWWTTRKPGAAPSAWAIVTSVVQFGQGLSILYYERSIVAGPGLIMAAIGIAGLIVFSRRELPSAHAGSAASVAGDRTSPWMNRAVTALSILARLSSIFLWSFWARSHGLLRSRGLAWLVLIALAILASSVLHESGHALVAWGLHRKLLSFHAGPFQWQRRGAAWRFNLRAPGHTTAGGAVAAVPTRLGQPRSHDLCMFAAGPLANLLVGLLALSAVLRAHWMFYQQTWEVLALTASFSLIAAVLNLFPSRSRDGAYSDGARILQILTHSPLEDFHRTIAGLRSTRIAPPPRGTWTPQSMPYRVFGADPVAAAD